MNKTITEVYLKDASRIEAKNSDIKEVQDSFFKLMKKDTYCFLIPLENINYIHTYVENE